MISNHNLKPIVIHLLTTVLFNLLVSPIFNYSSSIHAYGVTLKFQNMAYQMTCWKKMCIPVPGYSTPSHIRSMLFSKYFPTEHWTIFFHMEITWDGHI